MAKKVKENKGIVIKQGDSLMVSIKGDVTGSLQLTPKDRVIKEYYKDYIIIRKLEV